MNTARKLIAGAAFATLVALATPAMASGTSGGGGFPREPVVRDPVLEAQRQAYDRGRRVFRRELTCKAECPFKEGIKNREQAIAALERIRAGEVELSQEKIADLLVYMDRRFRLAGEG